VRPQKQETDLTSQGGFDPRVITNVFDLVTILIQQIQEQLDRTIKFPTTDSSLSVQLSSAETRAGKILCFGADGSPSLVAMAPSGASLFSGSLSETADGVRTVFTLTNNGSPIGKAPIQVTVWDNYPLVAGTGYNLGPEPGQVTFTTAPQVGDTLFAQGVF
jgi:hypothetical protein